MVLQLPQDLQLRVRSQLTQRQLYDLDAPPGGSGGGPTLHRPLIQQQRAKVIRVPMPTFPPTAYVYSVSRDVETDRGATDRGVENGDGGAGRNRLDR